MKTKMMKTAGLFLGSSLLTTLAWTSAQAYQVGAFSCTPYDKTMPETRIEIQKLTITGKEVPFVSITRYEKVDNRIVSLEVSGVATRFVSDGAESLKLEALEFYFKDGLLQGCH